MNIFKLKIIFIIINTPVNNVLSVPVLLYLIRAVIFILPTLLTFQNTTSTTQQTLNVQIQQ